MFRTLSIDFLLNYLKVPYKPFYVSPANCDNKRHLARKYSVNINRMQECSSLEHTYGTSITLQDRRLQYHISVCVHNWSCAVSHFLTFCRSTEWTSRVSHAQVECITFTAEPYVIFRFMHLLSITSWHVWVKARHLGLEERPYGHLDLLKSCPV